MKNSSSILFLVLLLSSCKIKRDLQTIAPSFSTLHLENLIAKDISENKSRISTMEDEIYLFIFQTRAQQIINKWQSPLWSFTTEHNQQSLPISLSQLKLDDRVSFFLLELDNDTLSNEIIQQLENWVSAENFPATFDQLRADNEIGDDDLLGVQSFLFSNLDQNIPIIFSGIQLFDRYKYELYYKLN